MRKALIIFLLAFALTMGGACYAFCDLLAPRDEVVVTETLRYGDASAAEGLSLMMHTNFDDHLFWDTSYTPGQPEKTVADYRVSVKKDYGDYDYEPQGVHLMVDMDTWMIEDQKNVDPSELSGMARAYQELWLETPAGEEREKFIYLKDYYDYYPISSQLDAMNIGYNEDVDGRDPDIIQQLMDSEEYSKYANRVFNDYFKIPVLENESRYISLRKDENGNIRGRGSGSGDGEAFHLWTDAVVLPDGIYFTIHNRSSEGNIVDTSQIPGGYGIYHIPHVSAAEGTMVDLESLSTVKSLDENFEVTYLLADEPKEKLILIGEINGELRMLVIDVATMETLQDIEIVSTGNVGCWQYFDGGDFLALSIDDNRLGLVERQESGEYIVRFVVEDIADGTYYNRYDVQAVAWNGEKLALSGYKNLRDINERFVADFYYAVYDETGLLCFTDCDSSLCINEDEQWGCVRGNDVNSMTLEWR